jgi:phosphoribosylformimino-5-aminoimidazole carboxamide ribotide isomerase
VNSFSSCSILQSGRKAFVNPAALVNPVKGVPRLVGVIDLLGGRAVHARGGVRAAYAPVGVAAGVRLDGDPLALARVYVEQLGVRELYLADLDAIRGGLDAMNAATIGAISALGAGLWVDAGVSAPAAARGVLDAGASMLVVGLETLTSFGELTAICADVGGRRIAFSVDLRNGQTLTLPDVAQAGWPPERIAGDAVAAGVGTVMVLDLARVGTAAGIDTALLGRIRATVPNVALFAGGGVRDQADLDALARIGCDGALVATALLSGAIRP